MVTGESHFVWGVRYRLKLVERPGRAHIETDGNRLLLYVPTGSTEDRRREQLDQWYRDQLKCSIPELIANWERKLDVTLPRWTLRRMKTERGSCNRQTRHLWFNVELAISTPTR